MLNWNLQPRRRTIGERKRNCGGRRLLGRLISIHWKSSSSVLGFSYWFSCSIHDWAFCQKIFCTRYGPSIRLGPGALPCLPRPKDGPARSTMMPKPLHCRVEQTSPRLPASTKIHGPCRHRHRNQSCELRGTVKMRMRVCVSV